MPTPYEEDLCCITARETHKGRPGCAQQAHKALHRAPSLARRSDHLPRCDGPDPQAHIRHERRHHQEQERRQAAARSAPDKVKHRRAHRHQHDAHGRERHEPEQSVGAPVDLAYQGRGLLVEVRHGPAAALEPAARSSSDPPSTCITPSTETFVLVVSFMVAAPFSSVRSCL